MPSRVEKRQRKQPPLLQSTGVNNYCLKNVPTLASCIFDKHGLIVINCDSCLLKIIKIVPSLLKLLLVKVGAFLLRHSLETARRQQSKSSIICKGTVNQHRNK